MSEAAGIKKRAIVLAAGGTGGHIFPAQALAESLAQRGYRPVLMTDYRFARYAGAFQGLEVKALRTGSMNGPAYKRIFGLFGMGMGLLQAMWQLMRLRPAAVIGFGGYPSFPTMFAATLLGLPTMIHEQNAIIGRANRLLSSRVRKIAASFSNTSGTGKAEQARVVVTGNPVRAAIRTLRQVPYPVLSETGAMRLLVLGGSQGASVFSRVVPAAIAALPANLRHRIRVDQQCRAEDLDATREAYQGLGVSADLATFFTDIPARLASAHLVISRAGASTVAELLAAGRPSILVPLPSAMDDHQTANANAVEDSGCGWLMPEEAFTPEALLTRLESYLNLASTLQEAAASAQSLPFVDSAAKLADELEKLFEEKQKKDGVSIKSKKGGSGENAPGLNREKAA